MKCRCTIRFGVLEAHALQGILDHMPMLRSSVFSYRRIWQTGCGFQIFIGCTGGAAAAGACRSLPARRACGCGSCEAIGELQRQRSPLISKPPWLDQRGRSCVELTPRRRE